MTVSASIFPTRNLNQSFRSLCEGAREIPSRQLRQVHRKLAENLKSLLKAAIQAQKCGDLKTAESAYRHILSVEPKHADALHLLGTCFAQKGRQGEACDYFLSALAVEPKRAAFHHNLASVLAQLGEHRRAEGHFREAIRILPDYAEAFFNMATVVKLHHPDPLTDQIESLLTKVGLSDADRCFLSFAAGKFYDDLGEYDRGFEHYAVGNTSKGATFDISAEVTRLESLKRVFSEPFPALEEQSGCPDTRPIFVVGMPRSGTSLLEQILASHPEVYGAGELPDIASIATQIGKYDPGKRPYPDCLTFLPQATFAGLGGAYMKQREAAAKGMLRIVDKHPLNFWHLGLIACLFPNATIIHCRRAPLDTCLSCFFQNFRSGQEFSFDLTNLGSFYRLYRQAMSFWQERLPGKIIEVHYETLTADPEAQSRKLLEACDLPWDPACATPHRTERKVATASSWQVRQPIHGKSAGRARHYRKHLDELIETLGPELSDEA